MKFSRRSFFSLQVVAALALVAWFTPTPVQAEDAKSAPAGTWTWTTPGRNGGPERKNTLKLKVEGEKLMGKHTAPGQNGDPVETDITDGKIKGAEIEFKITRTFGDNKLVGLQGQGRRRQDQGCRSSNATARKRSARGGQAGMKRSRRSTAFECARQIPLNSPQPRLAPWPPLGRTALGATKRRLRRLRPRTHITSRNPAGPRVRCRIASPLPVPSLAGRDSRPVASGSPSPARFHHDAAPPRSFFPSR
jgi:hypothetical protein